MRVRRLLMFMTPNLLTGFRLVAGPIYLAFGTIPVTTIQFLTLFLAGGTDLVDGRIARAWKTTSLFGRFLDPLADRILIACVLFKMALADVLPWWTIWVILVQYAALSGVFITYHARKGLPPPPDFWARLGSGLAALAGMTGVTALSAPAAVTLVSLFIAANVIYVISIGRRILGYSSFAA